MADDAAAPPTTVENVDENNRPKVGSRDNIVSWYEPGPPNISDSSRELLEKYANIPPEDVVKHLEAVRDRAWEIHPYPCIGLFNFIDLSLSRNPAYEHILSLLKGHDVSSSSPAPRLLDIGCCLGQDIRKLIYDGAPDSLLTGADLQVGFMEMGYDLFRDRETIRAKFATGDVFSDAFSDMHGTFTVVHAASILHLWNWEGQVEVGSRIVKLLKDETGVMVVGRQIGSITPGHKSPNDVPDTTTRGTQRYRHDPETFAKLWDEIGQKTGTKWKSEATLDDIRRQRITNWHDDSIRRITFEVTRVG